MLIQYRPEFVMDHMNVVSPSSLRKKMHKSDFKMIWSGSHSHRSDSVDKSQRSNVMEQYLEGRSKSSEIKLKPPPVT